MLKWLAFVVCGWFGLKSSDLWCVIYQLGIRRESRVSPQIDFFSLSLSIPPFHSITRNRRPHQNVEEDPRNEEKSRFCLDYRVSLASRRRLIVGRWRPQTRLSVLQDPGNQLPDREKGEGGYTTRMGNSYRYSVFVFTFNNCSSFFFFIYLFLFCVYLSGYEEVKV